MSRRSIRHIAVRPAPDYSDTSSIVSDSHYDPMTMYIGSGNRAYVDDYPDYDDTGGNQAAVPQADYGEEDAPDDDVLDYEDRAPDQMKVARKDMEADYNKGDVYNPHAEAADHHKNYIPDEAVKVNGSSLGSYGIISELSTKPISQQLSIHTLDCPTFRLRFPRRKRQGLPVLKIEDSSVTVNRVPLSKLQQHFNQMYKKEK